MADQEKIQSSRVVKLRNLELFELYAAAAQEVFLKLFNPHEPLIETKRALENYIEKLVEGIEGDNRAVYEILANIEFGNRFVSHSLKTTIVSLILGKQLNFPVGKLFALGSAAFLHDVGKARSDNPLINSYYEGLNDPQELERNHPLIGANIASDLLGYGADVAQGIRNHHEQLDGKGFPRGLTAGSISLLDRVIFTANFIDNLLYKTDYSGSEAVTKAVKHTFERFPAKFDPDIKDLLLAFSEKPTVSKRRYERTVITLAASYRRLDSAGNYSCRILDISGVGARIRCKETMTNGTAIYLSFSLSNLMSFNDLICHVIRRIPDENGYVYGLEVEDASGEIQQKIDRYLQRFQIKKR